MVTYKVHIKRGLPYAYFELLEQYLTECVTYCNKHWCNIDLYIRDPVIKQITIYHVTPISLPSSIRSEVNKTTYLPVSVHFNEQA